jgi:hypothetical protein
MGKEHQEENFYRSRVLNMAIYDESGRRRGEFQSSPRLSTFEADQFA